MNKDILRIKTRNFTINKKKNKVPSKGLIKSWKLLNEKDLEPYLLINNNIFKFKLNEKNKIDFSYIRSSIRNFEEDFEDNLFYTLEKQFYVYQLESLDYYKDFSNDTLYNSLFTKDLTINILTDKLNEDNDIEIEEEYYERKII